MGLGDKLIARVELQAETLAEYRQLCEKRRSRICDLERKLGDAQMERDKLAAEIETLRKELDTLTHLSQEQCETLRKQRDAAEEAADNLRVSANNLQKDRDHWRRAQQDAIEAGELMQAEIETLKGAMAADDQRLRDAEERVWLGGTWGCDAPDKLADEILHLRKQLDAAHSDYALAQSGTLLQQLDAAQAELTRQRLYAEERNELNCIQQKGGE